MLPGIVLHSKLKQDYTWWDRVSDQETDFHLPVELVGLGEKMDDLRDFFT